MNAVKTILRMGRQALFALSCLTLFVWTVAPTASHVPTVIETLQEHAEMIATHGHSHGLEEDLMWALHGHSHDVADHDHSQAVLIPGRITSQTLVFSMAWRSASHSDWNPPHFRLERPPRV